MQLNFSIHSNLLYPFRSFHSQVCKTVNSVTNYPAWFRPTCSSMSVDNEGLTFQHRLFDLIPVLALVGLLHAVLLWSLTTLLSHPPEAVIPPAVIGQLVSRVPITEPQPLPVQAKPARPNPVSKPRSSAPLPAMPLVPPRPMAPPSEQAVKAATSANEPSPHLAVSLDPKLEAINPAPEPKESAEPVILPRSDASFLNNPAPTYPAQSRRLREEGRVLVDVYILASGSVGEFRLKRSSGFARLDEAALQAVRQWRYVPAKRGDEPIAYWYVQPVDFAIR
jgi:periplasmic protein TonB